MKTLLFIISLFLTTNSFAQLPVWIQQTGKPETKLVLQQTYTKEEIVAKYGELERYSSFYDDEVYYATVQRIEFECLFVQTIDNKINQFSFGCKQMELRMECWDMTIKPGDDINKYRNLPKEKGTVTTYSDHFRIYVKINGNDLDEHLVLYFNEEKKIDSIEWFVPI